MTHSCSAKDSSDFSNKIFDLGTIAWNFHILQKFSSPAANEKLHYKSYQWVQPVALKLQDNVVNIKLDTYYWWWRSLLQLLLLVTLLMTGTNLYFAILEAFAWWHFRRLTSSICFSHSSSGKVDSAKPQNNHLRKWASRELRMKFERFFDFGFRHWGEFK